MSLIWQEKASNFLQKSRKYQVLWWGFGSTMLEILCKEKGFDAKELLEKKSSRNAQLEKQCVELLEAWGEKKIHWWWPWSKKMKDIELDEKQLQRARNYKKYSFFWKIIFSLFTSILIHRQALKRNNLISYYTGGDSMPNASISYGKEKGVSRSNETTINLEKEKGASQGSENLEHIGNIVPGGALVDYNIALDFLSLGSRRFDSCILNDATLGDALKLLNLPNLLENLDNDLEMVKRKEKNKAEHEKYFNQEVNDKFKKLSRKYHPDQIQKKGGSNEDITRATEMQQGVNLVWKVLKMLHSNFINNNFLSNQDFKYSTCSKVEISILSNEERLRSINNKVLIELCWLSRIKHEEIIPNLNEFLKLGQSSIQNFLSNDGSSFAQQRRQALTYLKKYLSGYGKLVDALSSLQKECQEDNDLSCIKSSVDKMLNKNAEQLKMLEELEKFSKKNPQKYSSDYINNRKDADRDFVLPFIEYINIISVCNKIANKQENKKNLVSRGLDWVGEKWNNLQQNPSVEEDSEVGISDQEVVDIAGRIADSASCYRLLNCLVTYYCYSDGKSGKNVVKILKDELNIDIKINKKAAEVLLTQMIRTYKEHLEKKFEPKRSFFATYDKVEQFKKDMEEILERFKSNMQEIGKEYQKIEEDQNRIREDLRRIAKQDEAAIKELEEESQNMAREMEEKLKEESQNRKREMEEKLKEESQNRKREMEEKLKEESQNRKREMEEKLKEESQNRKREMEEKLKEESQNRKREMEEKLKEKLKEESQNRKREMEEMKAQFIELMKEAVKGSQEASTSQQQSARAANNQQKESESDSQFDQQQQPNAQATANDQPSSELSEVQQISRSQSMNSLHSDDSDSGTKIGGSSQCR